MPDTRTPGYYWIKTKPDIDGNNEPEVCLWTGAVWRNLDGVEFADDGSYVVTVVDRCEEPTEVEGYPV